MSLFCEFIFKSKRLEINQKASDMIQLKIELKISPGKPVTNYRCLVSKQSIALLNVQFELLVL